MKLVSIQLIVESRPLHLFMKHTIEGRHNHVYQLIRDDSKAMGYRMEPICQNRSDSANTEFVGKVLELRERISLKWKVCLWCWNPDPKELFTNADRSKTIAYDCGFGKCKKWTKVKRKK